MNKAAFHLACFKMTQRIAYDGRIPENKSCMHALERGDALAMLGKALASMERLRKRAYGSPAHKAAGTRVGKAHIKLDHALGRVVTLDYDNPFFPFWPSAAFVDTATGKQVFSFDVPNPENF
jgi:hypothetical protein